jgi:hypothetical protein
MNYSKIIQHWVTESTRTNILNGKTIEVSIQELLDEQPPLTKELIVYRGQHEDRRSILPGSWFSTSKQLDLVRRQHISKEHTCCIFKIHLQPGIKIVDVKNYTNERTQTSFKEEEIIVNGNGVFYKTAERKEIGFTEIDDYDSITMFETWYALPPGKKKKPTADEIFERIMPEEYEFYENINNIKRFKILLKDEEANDKTLDKVIKMIQSSTNAVSTAETSTATTTQGGSIKRKKSKPKIFKRKTRRRNS